MASYPSPQDTDAAIRPGGGARSERRLEPGQERELVEAARRGDPEAVERLLRAYQRRIYAVCARMVNHPEDAADLTQDTLVKVIESLGTFDGRAAFSTWVIRIAMNASISALRKRKVRRHASLDDRGGGGEDAGQPLAARLEKLGEPGVHERVEHDEMQGLLLRALDELDPQMKAILVLRDMQDLEYQQIGTVLEVPIGTVKSRLFRARAALRTLLEETSAGQGDPARAESSRPEPSVPNGDRENAAPER